MKDFAAMNEAYIAVSHPGDFENGTDQIVPTRKPTFEDLYSGWMSAWSRNNRRN
jgi:hypothetical protein